MKHFFACLFAICLLAVLPGSGWAHRVNVFAFADGDSILVECYFSESQKVRNGKILVSDLQTGATLLEGVTDERGLFRFRPDEAFLQTGHGLNLLLNAGEGHQNHWRVLPEELAALSPQARTAAPAPIATQTRTPAPAQTAEALPESGIAVVAEPVLSPTAAGYVNAAELEAIVGRVVDEKLLPLKQALARQADSAPSLRDVVGGLGWIIGLLGLAAYMRHRR